MLLGFSATAAMPQTAAAQAAPQRAPLFRPADPVTIFGPTVTVAPVDPDIVVARLMTFDADNDGRLVKSELPERMQSLLAAEASGDQALDRDEIRALARPAGPALMTTAPGFRGGGGGYTFGDQVSLSTRAHVEGALDDLRLTPSAHQQALEIIRPFMTRLEADATTELLDELDGVMSETQLRNFQAMLQRQLSGNGMPVVTQRNGMNVNVFRLFGPDPVMMINSFALPPDHTKAAVAAFERFKARLRPADADRAALLAELKDVLNEEERDNFGAALSRRPLVKAGGGVIGGIVGPVAPPLPLPPPPPGSRIEGPAVFNLLLTPERRVLTP
jgi:hypothetical protein